ncbi:MAG: peptidylprolyl isomerase [Burkholderiaceae bacterium]
MRAWRGVAGCIASTLALIAISIGSAWAVGPRVAFDTSKGRIVVELDPEHAPISTQNFLRYVADGHYDGTLFHRVVENFMIQGGGLDAQMTEKKTRPAIANEAKNGLSNRAGTIAMAREAAIDTATAQFYINVVDNSRLDHVEVPPEGVTVTRGGKEIHVMPAEADRVFGYAVFGRVVEGMDVVERIRHVPVHTIGEGEDMHKNVPNENVIITRAVLLPAT